MADYHEPVVTALREARIFASIINPKLIKDFGNNSRRKVKTAKADAVKIARYAIPADTSFGNDSIQHMCRGFRNIRELVDAYR